MKKWSAPAIAELNLEATESGLLPLGCEWWFVSNPGCQEETNEEGNPENGGDKDTPVTPGTGDVTDLNS